MRQKCKNLIQKDFLFTFYSPKYVLVNLAWGAKIEMEKETKETQKTSQKICPSRHAHQNMCWPKCDLDTTRVSQTPAWHMNYIIVVGDHPVTPTLLVGANRVEVKSRVILFMGKQNVMDHGWVDYVMCGCMWSVEVVISSQMLYGRGGCDCNMTQRVTCFKPSSKTILFVYDT